MQIKQKVALTSDVQIDSHVISIAWRAFSVNPHSKLPRNESWKDLIAEGIQQE